MNSHNPPISQLNQSTFQSKMLSKYKQSLRDAWGVYSEMPEEDVLAVFRALWLDWDKIYKFWIQFVFLKMGWFSFKMVSSWHCLELLAVVQGLTLDWTAGIVISSFIELNEGTKINLVHQANHSIDWHQFIINWFWHHRNNLLTYYTTI